MMSEQGSVASGKSGRSHFGFTPISSFLMSKNNRNIMNWINKYGHSIPINNFPGDVI